jgi:peptide/nickel transport system substrate-binding protein
MRSSQRLFYLMPAVLCVALALTSLTAGCSKISTSMERNPRNGSVPGVLRLSDISDPSTLNPMFSGADIAYQLSAFTLEYLVQLDDKGNIIPVLCERVPSVANGDISKDGLTITYHLRRGVRWSDGVAFTSDDVIASWHQVMNPLNNVILREGYDDVASIAAPTPYTAVLHLKHPYASMPTRFFAAIQEGPIAVMPAHIIAGFRDLNRAAFNAAPVGTGPFLLQSWEHSGRMIFVANPHYWRGEPKLHEIIFQAQPSTSTQLIGFQTHEIDASFDAGAGGLPEYHMLSGMHVVRSRSLRLSVAVMNCQRFPFNDVRVRRAFAYALDRNAMLHDVFFDAGTVADEFVPPWSWAYTPDVPRYPFEPAKANAELAAAGFVRGANGVRYRNGQALSVVLVATGGDQPGARVAAMVQSYLRTVGFVVTIKDYPYGLIFDNSGPIRTGNFNLTMYSYSVNYDPSALGDFGCQWFSPNGSNDSRFCNPITDALENQALTTTNQKERKTLYAEIERQRMSDLPRLPLYFRDRVGVVTNSMRDYSPSMGIIPQWNAQVWSIP